MTNLTLLDVTLRDGGYVNNWGFSQDLAQSVVTDLTAAGIDFVEIGYRNSPSGHDNPGLSGRCSDAYIKAIRAASPTAKLSVMYSPDTVTLGDIDTLAQLGVSMVRCSIPAGNLESALPLIKHAKDLGMVSTANLTTVTEYKTDELVADCNKAVENGCSVLYVADTNGTMTPDRVKALFELLKTKVPPIPLGFHNHNNLGMGMANAAEAIRSGVNYVDCTLRGMGRSAGNVPTESLVTYLHCQGQGDNLNLMQILTLAQYFVAQVPLADPKPTLEDMALGAYNFFTNVQPFVTQAAAQYGVSWYKLLAKMASLDLDKPKITQEQVMSIARQFSNS